MSPIHLKNGLNHTLVIEHNVAALMAHCLMHWCWLEEFRKGQFWAQYYSRCTSTTFQLESPTQMSTYMQTNSDPLLIQRGLQDSLDRTSRWPSLNKMVPNTKKTKHLIIGTVQKLLHSGNPSLDLSLCGTPIEEAKDEKLLGVKIDKHLNWDNHIDFLIDKLNSRICLLKRAKTYLNHRLGNLLYNALIRPLFEYCCTVWGNTKNENLLRLLRVQKRCARLILDANFSDNSVELFSKLGWLPIDDVIRMRKLCLMHKIVNGCCPQYFKDYISYVNDKHRHNTRASTNNNLFIPLFRTNSGLRTFYASVNRLWNTLEVSTRSITPLRNFKKYISNKYAVSNSKLDHFTIHRTF